MNLASWVLVGGAAGVVAGVLFGDACAILSPIGFAYVGLLEAAVYPYLICSLLHGLGSLQPSKAWRLFKCGWVFYVAAWVVTFAALGALVRAIPAAHLAVLGAAAPLRTRSRACSICSSRPISSPPGPRRIPRPVTVCVCAEHRSEVAAGQLTRYRRTIASSSTSPKPGSGDSSIDPSVMAGRLVHMACQTGSRSGSAKHST